MRQVSDLKSTTVVRRYGILTICHPLPLGGAQGAKMTNIAYLLVMTIDLTSETWYKLANGAPGHHTVLYRTGIHAVLAEISHMRHFGVPGVHGHEPSFPRFARHWDLKIALNGWHQRVLHAILGRKGYWGIFFV